MKKKINHDKKPLDFSKNPTTIYCTVALNYDKKIEDATLKDLLILNRDDNQLKWMQWLDKEKSTATNKVIRPKQFVGYVKIDQPIIFEEFLKTFFYNHSDQINKYGYPKIMDDLLYAGIDKKTVDGYTEDLRKKQDVYYQGLLEEIKPNTNKLNLFTVDLLMMLANYMNDVVLPTDYHFNSSEIIKAFEHIKPHPAKEKSNEQKA